MIYKKKITSDLGWLRPVEKAEPLMRVGGIVEEGYEETSQFGPYIRWIGKFQCKAVQRDGTISVYSSRNLILPTVASDMVAESFKVEREKEGTKLANNRTGKIFVPAQDGQIDVMILLDIYLVPPSSEHASQTGYEYEPRSVLPDANNDLIGRIETGLPQFAGIPAPTDQASLPPPDGTTPAAPEAEPAPTAQPAEEVKHARRKAG